MLYLGIDPGGSSGGASLLDDEGQPCLRETSDKLDVICFGKSTEHEIGEWFAELTSVAQIGEIVAALERVHSMPQQSAQSGFSFGRNYGLLRGLLIAYSIPFEEPTPQRWQKELNCATKGDKNVSKARAHELWPKYTKQITHAVADSMLIAEWLRRTRK